MENIEPEKEVPANVSIENSSEVIGRGRKFKVPINVQLEEYRSRSKELLDANNKILPATAAVFHEISQKFGGQMSSKAIQLAVTKNAIQIFGENFVKTTDVKTKAYDDSYEFSSYDKNGLTASLTIDEKNAEKFKILTVAGNKRSYTTLRPGWTDALHDLIVEETNTQCVFQFKRISVVGKEFVTHAVSV